MEKTEGIDEIVCPWCGECIEIDDPDDIHPLGIDLICEECGQKFQILDVITRVHVITNKG